MNTPSAPRATPARRRCAALAAAFLATTTLGACASFSADGGFGPVEQAARTHLGKEVRNARTDADHDASARRVAELLAAPLDVEAAVQVALLNNAGLQAEFAELGITEAELVRAGRLPNPGFGFARLRRGGETELERGLHFDLARLIAMPLIREVEARRFAQARQLAAMRVLALAADTRKAWFHAVAAEESLRYQRQVLDAADASAELARRMARAGTYSKLQRAREQAFYADAALAYARAGRVRLAARERLTRLLGLWGTQTAFALPSRLPELPDAATDMPEVERVAMRQRLDVQAARTMAEQTARNLGLTRTTRFVNVLEFGVVRNTSNEAPPQRGWEVGLELPLFDWGDSRVARAEAIYRQALARAAQTAVDARSEVREAYGAYRSAFDVARHFRDEIVPLRRHIAEENVLRYNAMLIGVFELLADARVQIASVNGYVDALRDFWIARADLDMALVGKPALAMPSGPTTAAAEAGGGGH